MSLFVDRVYETTVTTGTGPITMAGAVLGYFTWAAKVPNPSIVDYTIVNAATGEVEVGRGTWTTTLARDTVISSSNANALVNFAAGTKDVFLTAVGSSLIPRTLVADTTLDLGTYGLWLKSVVGGELYRGDLGPANPFLAAVFGTPSYPGQVNSNALGVNGWSDSTLVFNQLLTESVLRANGVYADDYTDPGILALTDGDPIYSKTFYGWCGAPNYFAAGVIVNVTVDGTPDGTICPMRVDVTNGVDNVVSISPTGDVTLGHDLSAANLSGTNTGNVTLAAVGAAPNANAASLSGQALTLQPASVSFPGVVTTGTQSFAGVKTFASPVTIPDPVAATDAVNLQTLQTYLASLDSKTQCAYASTAALPANTYANGTLGVGATLTGTANGPLIIDGVTTITANLGERVLVAGEATGSKNGWYTITQIGVIAVSPYILTRATGDDQAAEIGPGYLTAIEAPSGLTGGTANNGKVFLSVAPVPFVVGTDTVTFGTAGNTYTAGTGLTLTGTVFAPDFGSGAGKVTQGNDSRLSDARTPVGTALTSALVWVGSAGNVAAAVAVSGDFTLTNAGVGALSNNATARTNLGLDTNPSLIFASVVTAVALNNSNVAASIFAAANDALTVAANTTYIMEGVIRVTNGNTTHTDAFGFGGTATFTSIGYDVHASKGNAGVVSAVTASTWIATAASTVFTATTTNQGCTARIRGMIRTNGAGTIIPQWTFSADPTGTCQVEPNSYLTFRRVGADTLASNGAWA